MEENDERNKAIELRSEEVQEVMSEIPSWILRYGLALFLIIVLLLLGGSCLFKYPDVLQAEITLTSLAPPVSIIARLTGKIDTIYVSNNQPVVQGEPLAVIQTSANTSDMLRLLKNMKEWRKDGYAIERTEVLFPSQLFSLGTTQSLYSSFLNSLNDFKIYKELNYYPRKIIFQKEQLIIQREYYTRILKQNSVIIEQFTTSRNLFERDSILFSKKIISGYDYDLAKNNFLQQKQSYLSFNASLKQSELQLMQGEQNLLDLQQQASELESKYRLALHNATESLDAQIKAWEHDCVMSSPITGIVSQMGFWSNNQNVSSGKTVFTVIPSKQNTPKGTAMLPIQGAGKVKIRQRVNVFINNFPDKEFGYLIGEVTGISRVPITTPTGDFYILEIDFPNGMRTNYEKTLPISQQMLGRADIITEDLRLIERFFMPIKKILKNQNSTIIEKEQGYH